MFSSSSDFWFKAWLLESGRLGFEYQLHHLTDKTLGKLFHLTKLQFPNP